MSEESKLKILVLGLLSASAIGGEACKDCQHNIPRRSAALLTGDGEALRDCAKLLFKDCELVPGGTKARIAELEAERDRLRKALQEIKHVPCRKEGGMYDSDGDWYVNECSSCRRMHDIAREALKGAENE